MRKYTLSIASAVVIALCTLSSCLGDNESGTYYDAAITAFTLGTLNRYIHTTASDGETDSIYKKTLDCSGYSFYIDQYGGAIWNPDSLPVDVDPSAVICTITAKNSSYVSIKSLTSDSLTWYSSSDSIDFSEPREMTVYSYSGTAARTYTVSVNVHQEVGDTCIWTQVLSSSTMLGALTDMRAVENDDVIYLFGNANSVPKVYTTDVEDGASWTEVDADALSEESSKSVIMKNGVLFTIANGEVLTSVDAANWQAVGDATDLKQLVAASTVHLYALSTDGKLLSSEDGTSWAEEELDEDAALLPVEDISYACHALETNVETDKLVLIGNRSSSDYPSDNTAVVWSKVDEYGSGSRDNKWNFVEFSSDNAHKAPRATNWQIVNYDANNIKAISGDGVVGEDSVVTALSNIYHSGDDGITWRNDSVMMVPDDISSSSTSFAFASDGRSVWIICGGTGQVWKGRINRVAWKEEQDYFTE